MSLAASYETWVRRCGNLLMGRRHYIPLRYCHNIPIRRCGDVPLGRLGDVPLGRRWVFHLRRTCDVAGTYREMPLRRRYDVLVPVRKLAFIILTYLFYLVDYNNIISAK